MRSWQDTEPVGHLVPRTLYGEARASIPFYLRRLRNLGRAAGEADLASALDQLISLRAAGQIGDAARALAAVGTVERFVDIPELLELDRIIDLVGELGDADAARAFAMLGLLVIDGRSADVVTALEPLVAEVVVEPETAEEDEGEGGAR